MWEIFDQKSGKILWRTRYEWWAKFLSYNVFGSWSDYVREGEGYTDVHIDNRSE